MDPNGLIPDFIVVAHSPLSKTPVVRFMTKILICHNLTFRAKRGRQEFPKSDSTN